MLQTGFGLWYILLPDCIDCKREGIHMKQYLWILVLCLMLSGCGSEPTFETVADVWVEPAMAQPKQMRVDIPGEAALPAMEQDSNRLYLGSDYEITLQTCPAGDLQSTIEQVSGFEESRLTVLETDVNGLSKAEFVWVSLGEQGEQLGRCVILDDGSYHYCLSVLRQADATSDSQINWDQVFTSFTLV